jgi:hypothetical protein
MLNGSTARSRSNGNHSSSDPRLNGSGPLLPKQAADAENIDVSSVITQVRRVGALVGLAGGWTEVVCRVLAPVLAMMWVVARLVVSAGLPRRVKGKRKAQCHSWERPGGSATC